MNNNYTSSFDLKKITNIVVYGYLLIICIYMISHRIWFSPDQFFFVGIFGATFIGKLKSFFQDWVPFILLYLGYELLRGFVPTFSKHVHIFPMIAVDKFIFGYIPTIKLQTLLYNPAHLKWYDYLAVIFYISHFIVPMLVGYYFWLEKKSYFSMYSLAILTLSYISFITYLVFPAMPPWMAAALGYIPPVKSITEVVLINFLHPHIYLPTLYSFIGKNPVAAMPSLHAAFPMLIFLFLFQWNRKLGLLIIPYVLGVWFAVIYLGEHYFIDVICGITYAVFIFFAFRALFMRKNSVNID